MTNTTILLFLFVYYPQQKPRITAAWHECIFYDIITYNREKGRASTMQLEWLGKYRTFIESLIFYVNIYGQIYNHQGFHDTSVPCSVAQIQVLEYILENEEKNQKMAEVANRLGISPSAFSKNVKKMVDKGLLDKYRSVNNKKDIIVKASPLGRNVYQEYVNSLWERRFKKTFEILDEIPEEYVQKFAEILKYNAESLIAQMNEHQNISTKETPEKPVGLVKIVP